MNLKTVTIADLKPHPQNPNTHPAKQIDALGDSLDEFDQVKNVVIWNGMMLAGHALREAAIKAGRLTLEAVDVSHWPEDKATAFMLADIRTPGMAIVDEAAMVEALRAMDAPLDIPGFDEDFLAGLPGFEPEPSPEPPEPPVDKAEELQEKWQCEAGQIWQIESKTNPGRYHRLICGDCRDVATVEAVTEGKLVNGVFTSPPYAMQRAKQYGGVPAGEYVGWWEAVQENMRAVLAEDGSFFVNIKPHCEDGQRVLYVFDLVLAMVRRWGWRFVDELYWKRRAYPGGFTNRFRNEIESVFHFATGDLKFRSENVLIESSVSKGHSPSRDSFSRWGSSLPPINFDDDKARPTNVIETSESEVGIAHEASFPLKLPTFFIKAYSDPLDAWLDPFAGSGTTALAAENEGRLGLMVEKLEKYCAVILERFQAHIGTEPELII